MTPRFKGKPNFDLPQPCPITLLVISNSWWSERTSFFPMINVIAAIFLARLRRAIVGFFP
jgi:hypothetical protein